MWIVQSIVGEERSHSLPHRSHRLWPEGFQGLEVAEGIGIVAVDGGHLQVHAFRQQVGFPTLRRSLVTTTKRFPTLRRSLVMTTKRFPTLRRSSVATTNRFPTLSPGRMPVAPGDRQDACATDVEHEPQSALADGGSWAMVCHATDHVCPAKLPFASPSPSITLPPCQPHRINVESQLRRCWSNAVAIASRTPRAVPGVG